MSKPDLLVISTSLNPRSRSKLLAKAAYETLAAAQATNWIDLQEHPLPLCDGGSAYGNEHVIELTARIKQAKCILVATPVYNFDVNAALKNLIELTGDAWTEKTVGFICAAGGKSSYMSVMSVANSLMLDFRSFIIPRFVYADGEGFEGDIIAPKMAARLDELCQQTIKLCAQLYPTISV